MRAKAHIKCGPLRMKTADKKDGKQRELNSPIQNQHYFKHEVIQTSVYNMSAMSSIKAPLPRNMYNCFWK